MPIHDIDSQALNSAFSHQPDTVMNDLLPRWRGIIEDTPATPGVQKLIIPIPDMPFLQLFSLFRCATPQDNFSKRMQPQLAGLLDEMAKSLLTAKDRINPCVIEDTIMIPSTASCIGGEFCAHEPH